MLNRVEQPGYVLLELNNPPVNVLTSGVLEALREATAHASAAGAGAILVRGAGRCFSAGADVAEHLPGKVERLLPLFRQMLLELSDFEGPTVAYVHGAALGGGFELALACDFIVAAEDAQFGLPEITLGVFPPFACALLPVLVGSSRALELLMTGERITARRAAELGLVVRVGPPEEAVRLIESLTSHPRPALAACKRAARLTVAERAAAAEKIYLDGLMRHPEPVEGLRAFLEKRPPRWRKP